MLPSPSPSPSPKSNRKGKEEFGLWAVSKILLAGLMINEVNERDGRERPGDASEAPGEWLGVEA